MTAEFFVLWAIWVLVGSVVGAMKGHGLAGFLWTFFLGPIGLIVVLAMPRDAYDHLDRDEWDRQKADLAKARSSQAAADVQEDGTFIPESMRAPKLPRRGNFELRKPSH